MPNQKLLIIHQNQKILLKQLLSKELIKTMDNSFLVDAHTYEKRVIVQIEKEGIYEFTNS